MHKSSLLRLALLSATMLGGAVLNHPARAQNADQRIQSIEQQIKQLQDELTRVKRELTARERQVRAAQATATQAREQAAQAQAQAQASQEAAMQAEAAVRVPLPGTVPPPGAVPPSGPPLPPGTIRIGGVTVTLGGFVAAEGVYRTRNQVADIGSNFNTAIPFPQSQLYHEGEFRGSARQSRLSLLVQGQPSPVSNVAAYYETDFLSSGTTSNSAESDSYTLRLRQAYGTYDNTEYGFHFLGGQAWSLATLNKIGITPRQEDIPLTIDAQYVVGFNWTRNWQLRFVKDFNDHKFWLGASVELPEVNYFIGPNGTGVPGTVNSTNPGGSLLNGTFNYSDDIAPDVILKVAADPGYGHYELYGLARFPHDRVSTVGSGNNNTAFAGGVGGGAILPIVRGKLDFQLSGLGGSGIGRYGSAQLPDVTINSNGAPEPLPEVEALIGLVGHPAPAWDLYSYLGTEQITGRRSFVSGGKPFGYGSPFYPNAGCEIELSPLACVANTSGIWQLTTGAWWRFLHGDFGTAEVGLQYSFTQRSVFSGLAPPGLNSGPSTNVNMIFFSFRYLPFI